jgi:hypothetical protein
MNSVFEGDLIRPLGLVTLYFGYAEFEVDSLLSALSGGTNISTTPGNAPLGQKLATLRNELTRLRLPEADQLVSIIDSARPLIELRNVLVHSCVLAKGRVVPSDRSQSEQTITPEQLTELADKIFTWKEQLSAASQLKLMPALKRRLHGGT